MREAGLRRELATQATEMTRLREALRECQGRSPRGARKVRGHVGRLKHDWAMGREILFRQKFI